MSDLRGKVPTIVVTDARARAALAVCRGLGVAGFRVAAISDSRSAPALWSRYCDESLVLPQVESDAEEYAAALAALVGGRGYSLLIPGTDPSLRTLSARRDIFEDHVRLALPPHSTVLDALDKARLGEVAAAVGMPAPDTAYCENIGEALSAAERFGYPVHLKPQLVVTKAGSRVTRYGSELVTAPDDLVATASALEPPYLVQRSMPGDVISCAGVRAGGRHLALAASRSIRNWPPGRGGWSYSITIDPPAGLADGVGRLLDHLGWEGIFEVELLTDASGGFYTIDLNPRPYGSLALAIAAGANLPEAWVAWVLGREPAFVVARAGVRYRWEDGDARWALRRLRQARWREAAAIARPHRGTAHAYLSWDDPGPFVARAVEGLTKSRAP